MLPCEWRLGVTTSLFRITPASCLVFEVLKILAKGTGWGFSKCPLWGIGLKVLGGLKELGKLRVLTCLNFPLFGAVKMAEPRRLLEPELELEDLRVNINRSPCGALSFSLKCSGSGPNKFFEAKGPPLRVSLDDS